MREKAELVSGERDELVVTGSSIKYQAGDQAISVSDRRRESMEPPPYVISSMSFFVPFENLIIGSSGE